MFHVEHPLNTPPPPSYSTQPGYEKVACYREVPVGQEHQYEDGEDGDDNKENGAAYNNTFRAPSNASSMSMMLSRAGTGAGGPAAGKKGGRGGRRRVAESTLKPKM